MHVELVVPALRAERETIREALAGERTIALEALIARGRRDEAGGGSLEDWLARAFGHAPQTLPAGALTLLAEGGTPGEAHWTRADPGHLRATHDGVSLLPAAALGLTHAEAATLAGAIDAHLGGGGALAALAPERWVMKSETGALPRGDPPLVAAGRDADRHLAGEARAHARLNELQMLLHGHPVNADREARGAPPVNTLWTWGDGRLPAQPARKPPWDAVSAEDAVARGLARHAGIALRPLAEDADAWLGQGPEEGRHLVVLDALRAPHALEDREAYLDALHALHAHWFAPLLLALRSGRIGMVTIHAAEAARTVSVETTRGDLRRFWRRTRPLAQWLD